MTSDSEAAGASSTILRLNGAGRAWRAAVLAAIVFGWMAGSLVGDDHWWPFGPWRMFSTATPPSGQVVYMSLKVKDEASADWRPAALNLWQVGLNRAEIEGQIPEITADPDRLGTLAATHAELRPGADRWTAVRLVRNESVLVDRKPTGELRRIIIAEWSAS